MNDLNPDPEKLGHRWTRDGVVLVAARMFRHGIVGATSAIVLARVLTPEDFGLFALTAAFVLFPVRFQSLGLDMATLQHGHLTPSLFNSVFWLSCSIGLTLCAASAALAPLLSWVFGDPRIGALALVLAPYFALEGLAIPFRASMRRQLRFRSLAVVQMLAPGAGVVSAVAAAMLDFGAFALAAAILATATVELMSLAALVKWKPGRPRLESTVRSLLEFGGHLTLARMLQYWSRHADDVLVGWAAGPTALGLYDRAYLLLLVPIRQFTTPITGVAVPVLSRLRSKPRAYRRVYSQGILMLASLGIPVVSVALVMTEDLVQLIFGPQWNEAVPIFQALGPAAIVATFNVAGSWVYLSLGHTGRMLRWAVFSAVVTILGLVVGSHWGVLGIAVSFSVTEVGLRLPSLWYCFRGTFVRLEDVFMQLARPAMAAAFAAAITLFVLTVFVPADEGTMRVCTGSVLFLCAYVSGWVFFPGGIDSLRRTYSVWEEEASVASRAEDTNPRWRNQHR